MQTKRGEETRGSTTEPALRIIMRRLREIMAEPGDGQARLDKIVQQISGLMVAEVCSIYLKRQDGSLELFATEGLNPRAVHQTRMKKGEGLVGRCADLAAPVNVPDAQHHPFFSYRPETGEEIYHSLLAVPILRAGQVLGVLVIQNRTPREYTDEDEEVLQTTAMLVAELIVSGAIPTSGGANGVETLLSRIVRGEPISEAIALGHVVVHQPRVVISKLLAEDVKQEEARLDSSVVDLRAALDEMLAHETVSMAGEHRDVLEAYRMFANDRGWLRRMRDAVREGLTAEAAVERVHNATRSQMLKQNDPFWRERLRDLDDLSDRLLRILTGVSNAAREGLSLPPDAVLVARTMGPAELLDYDRKRLRGLVLEEGSAQSHVAIVARALGIAAVGQVEGLLEAAQSGDDIIVDGETGEVHLRPSPEVISAFSDKVRLRARRQQKYLALKDVSAVSKDGVKIDVNINAGLPFDVEHLKDTGADGIGLYRTELQFMIASAFPRLDRQTEAYKRILDESGDRNVVFRALDIGGDKMLPYMKHAKEENPALGLRAIRLSLDRPALLRVQVRALLKAAAGHRLNIMIPMITEVAEILRARAIIEREIAIAKQRGVAPPKAFRLGAMIEVPSILYELDAVLKEVEFLSIGSNDLTQYLFASDRGNALVSSRYDTLSIPPLKAIQSVVEAGVRHGKPVTLCGEMAGKPLEAMALIGIGLRSLSMSPAAVGPVKSMILSLDVGRLTSRMNDLIGRGSGRIRAELERFAEADGIDV